MNNETVQVYQRRIEANIARGRRCIETMRISIAQERMMGHDTRAAERLMANFEEIQIAHVEGAQRLMAALRDLSR